jgi:hypothetical protein
MKRTVRRRDEAELDPNVEAGGCWSFCRRSAASASEERAEESESVSDYGV